MRTSCKSTRCGFVVTSRTGVLAIGGYEDTPIGGVLLLGDYGTVFNSRRSALAAIKRSQKYCDENNYVWNIASWIVVKVVFQEANERSARQ